MILVTGTFRSGTSMWMQVLQAAGLPPIGSAYPAYWGEVLGDFNARGFHESRLRAGVWWRTNPHPETGAYLFPSQTRRHVVKVFIDGLVRTDVAFVDHVVATMRDWRSYTRSFDALHTRERGWHEAQGLPFPGGPHDRPHPYEWWRQNYELVRDLATRRHPTSLTTYGRVVRDPAREVPAVLRRLELAAPDAVAAAVAAVDGRLSAPRPAHPDELLVPEEDARVFDLLYAAVDAEEAIGPALAAELNAAERRIHPRFAGGSGA